MRNVLENKKAIFIFIFPALFVFILIVFVPIVMSGYFSSLDWVLGQKVKTFVGFTNYINLFVNNTGGFNKSILNSLLIVILSLFIQLPIAFLLAVALAKGVRGESFFRSVFFIPCVISTVIIGQMWLKIYNYDYGLLNTAFKFFGLKGMVKDWLGNENNAMASVATTIVWQYIGYHMLLFYAAIKTVPKELVEAAKIDGASYFKTVYKIIVPSILPIIEICITFAVIGSLKAFDNVYIMTNGGPMHSSEVPSTLMYNTLFSQNVYGAGSAMAVFIVVECILLTLIIQRIFGKNYSN